jgi:hypothetical protein
VSKEAWYVLQQCELRSYSANDSDGFRPEIPLISLSAIASSNAKRLAWEACRDEVNGGEPSRVNCPDILESFDIGPVPFQYPAPVLVDLDLPRRCPAGQLEAEVHAAGQMPEKRLPNVCFFSGTG